MKAKVIPSIIGAIGTISKSLRKYLSNIPRRNEIKELQKKKNSHVGHCIHTTESVNVKVQNIFLCEITLHVAQTVNKEQLQPYVP